MIRAATFTMTPSPMWWFYTQAKLLLFSQNEEIHLQKKENICLQPYFHYLTLRPRPPHPGLTLYKCEAAATEAELFIYAAGLGSVHIKLDKSHLWIIAQLSLLLFCRVKKQVPGFHSVCRKKRKNKKNQQASGGNTLRFVKAQTLKTLQTFSRFKEAT